ncbi:glycosylphosphatidylinositol phospholipase D [Heterostelium album PN500]|uniref:Phosphatidylinositol-glycan-specific phospholipase D n=1 Tax=Heterostelium pallidum (strain ATCC 26659 / Pp 5 / PN500) TaxID=670386 RepID=D3AZT7_HETP5|nr:glycosylphosphatidylinositol phospholipase D [Heterostelium album PN500]EFA84561.1 glycosylphosphatidylinositol phospholipase D [Heterostelium album PN500]|eukprot:XP_020436674.1 glycosylphosphatidylinositol phospholipase D [Heterostelium album PN500]
MKYFHSLPLIIVVVIGIFITTSIFLSTNNVVDACGMTTHNEVARRAFNFSDFKEYPQFQQMILNNLASFQAGAAFPDWGYSCGGFAAESEAAHWPPFLRNASEYLLATYTQPWNAKAQSLAVFLLGVMSHQVADISWHSIAGDQNGLIASMAGQDFNGTYSVAHENADTGGEFVLAYNYNLDWLEDEWYVPVEDVKNIYHQMNYTTVTELALVKCNSILFAGAMAVKTGGRFLYPEIAEKSPFLIDHYQDYFNGGLDDMAVWTSYCWPVLMGWLEGEKIGNFCAIQPDPSFSHGHRRNGFEKIAEHFSDDAINILIDRMDIFKDHHNNYLISMNPIDPIELGFKVPPKPHNKMNDIPTNYSTIFSENAYSYFGRSLISHDLNNDGFDDLIVSAPGDGVPGAMQTGCVYYIMMGENNSSRFVNSAQFEINQIANGKVCGNEIHARFGWSTVLLDFNMDGVIDLVVGAPSSANADLNYFGKVFIYLGQMNGQQWSIDQSSPITINGTYFQDQAGLMLFTGDANNDGHQDLIIGMPTAGPNQQGKLAIFYSSEKRSSQHPLDLERDANFQAFGTTAFEWFGYHAAISSGLLLVGSPTFHEDGDLMNIGKITGFQLSKPKQPKFTLIGHYQFDKLGYTFQVVNGSFMGMNENLLVVGLPTRGYELREQVGEVMLIAFESLVGYVDLADCEVLLQVTGDTSYSRFGESLAMDLFEGSVPTLYIGSPLWTDSISTGSGAVYQYTINPPAKDKSNNNKSVTTVDGGSYVNNKEKDSRFGFRMVLADVNNDGKKDIIIGADRDSSKSLQSGSINIFFSN